MIVTYLFFSLVVGKPPSGLNVTIVSPTTLRLSWSPGDIQQLINLWGFRVAYRIIGSNETNGIVVDKHRTSVNISGLLSDSTYIIWVMSLTAKGFGVPSKALNVTTPSQGNVFRFYRLIQVFLRVDLVKDIHFAW